MSKINIRNHDKPLTFRALWVQDQYKKLRKNPALNHLSNMELKEYLLKKYEARRVVNGRFYNNTTSDNVIMNQEQFINEYLNKPYILSGYSCLYQNQDNSINISSAALENLRKHEKI